MPGSPNETQQSLMQELDELSHEIENATEIEEEGQEEESGG